MPYCAWCGHEVAAVSYAPCPQCGNATNGAPRPPAAGAGGNGSRTALIIVAVVAGGLVVVAIVGILAAIAIPNLLTAMQRAKQKRTMADLRSIGTAIEARATDTNDLPNVNDFEDLRPLLTPKYIKVLPGKDGWEHPFRYACAMEQGRCTGYILASGGKDGLLETGDLREELQSPRGPTTNFDCDIVYANGRFLEYPEGVQGGR